MNQSSQTITIQLAGILMLFASVCRGQDSVNQEISPEAQAAIEAVREAGGQVLRIAATARIMKRAFICPASRLRTRTSEPLKSIPSLVWLNLANTKITNDGLQHLAKLPLKKLHLEKNANRR